MKDKYWRDVFEVVGLSAIVASLVFVGLQIRQEQEIAIVDTYGELSQSNIDLTFQIGEHMAVWKKGLDGEELTTEERDSFAVLAAAVIEFNQRVWIRWIRLGPIDPGVAASKFAYTLYVFPGLRREWESIEQFDKSVDAARGFDEISPWNSTVNEYLEQFDKEKPPIPINKQYIFLSF